MGERGETLLLCAECDDAFLAKRKDSKFCSNACKKKDQYKRNKLKTTV